jgi:hypothetical protein
LYLYLIQMITLSLPLSLSLLPSRAEESYGTEVVNMTTINHFEDDYRLHHVDILKIDAEGSDSKVAVIMCDACLFTT